MTGWFCVCRLQLRLATNERKLKSASEKGFAKVEEQRQKVAESVRESLEDLRERTSKSPPCCDFRGRL